MPNTFDWIEIRTDDIQRAASFYESLFGWKIIARETAGGSEVWLFDTGGEPRLENLRRGGIWLRPKGQPLGVVVYVVVADIEATLQKAVALGGEVIDPKVALDGGYIACFRDPSGNLLGLYQDREAG
jgi:predicted enzyme related to lactoylglutathione lyase